MKKTDWLAEREEPGSNILHSPDPKAAKIRILSATASGAEFEQAQQLTEAFPWQEAPRHLIRDRDGIYGQVFRKRFGAMGIRDHPIAPRPPWQSACAERLIGSIRRECLDRVVVTGEAHLRRILRRYTHYYNRARTHRSLGKDCLVHRPFQKNGAISSTPVLGGLHHVYART